MGGSRVILAEAARGGKKRSREEGKRVFVCVRTTFLSTRERKVSKNDGKIYPVKSTNIS